MPRGARKKSKTGIYHMILRGINRNAIFEDEEDSLKFLQTLEECQMKSGFILYAYCLMGNHVHMLIKEEDEDLGNVMRRIGASYVYWYNWKYERCGHLFQDRYKSEVVEDEKYFLTVLRYIHQNPIKAGIVKEITNYSWSSYLEFIGKNKLIDIDFVLEHFSNDREKAIEQFISFHVIEENTICLEMEENRKWKDQAAIELIKVMCNINHCKELQNIDRAIQKKYLKRLYAEGLSIRQISRITGLGRWVIQNAINFK